MLLNRDRASSIMEAEDLVGLIASCGENITYSSGFAHWPMYTYKDQEVYSILTQAGQVALVVPLDAADYLAQEPTDASSVYFHGTFFMNRSPGVVLSGAEARLADIRAEAHVFPSSLEALGAALNDLHLRGCTVGLDERGMAPARWRLITETFADTSFVEAMDLFRRIRMVKTEDEITHLRQAVAGVEMGIEQVFSHARPGVSEADLESIFRATVVERGVAPGHYEVTAGSRSGANFPASADYKLRAGDVIRADCGGRCHWYFADTGRTGGLGDVPDLLGRYYIAMRAGIDAMLNAVGPGIRAGELFEIGVGTVVDSGIPHFKRHHAGHGIGLEMYEMPLLVDPNARPEIASIVLEPGMVINLELPYYEIGLGGIQLEETLVVRANGYDLLTTASRELQKLGN